MQHAVTHQREYFSDPILFPLTTTQEPYPPPVSMRAEEYHTVRIISNDSDFRVVEGARTRVPAGEVFTLPGTWNDIVEYVGDLDYVDMDDLVYSGGYLNMTVEVYRVNGASKGRTDVTGTTEGNAVLAGSKVDYDYDIELSFEIDYIGHDNGTVVGYGNGVDDRKDEIVTLKVEGWDEGKDEVTGKYSTTEYVVNDSNDDGKELTAFIEGLAIYADYYVVDEDIYELVFYVKGDTVKADWAEDKAGLDRFAPAATNDKDTNGDGKVSCDEYYGTTGLVWSDEKNACVVESNGAVVVTIPNTATK